MKILRVLLFATGVAALVWGALLFAEFAFPLRPDSFFTLGWLLGGPVVHDGLIAPAVGIAGLILSRLVPRSWRAPMVIGGVLSGVLAILSVPLLWRTYGAPPPPGPHNNATTGLLVSLGVVWAVVLITGTARSLAMHFAKP